MVIHTYTQNKSMACKLPHTAEEFQRFIKAQTENSDAGRRNAIVDVIGNFEVARGLNRKLREYYARCTDISDDRKNVINLFLNDGYRKDTVIVGQLWACVHQLEAQIANKIRWGYKENVESDKVEQQRQRQQRCASSSSAPRDVLQHPQLPDLNFHQLSYEDHVEADDSG